MTTTRVHTKSNADGIEELASTLAVDARARGYKVSLSTFDYAFKLAAGFEDPKTIVRVKPWKRIDKVLQFLRLQPHKHGPYRAGFKVDNQPNEREAIRWWVKREVYDAELRRLKRERDDPKPR